MQVTEILTDHTLMALDLQGAEDYPIRFYLDIMDQFDRAGIHWHWHPALEFNVITKGTMEYFVENEHYTLTAGQGIVKNAHLLHMAQPASHTPDAAMFSVIMDPAFLAPAGSVIYRKYIAPLLGSQGLGSLVLRPEVPWQRAMLEGLRQAYALSQAETGAYELAIHTHMCQIWIAMAEHQDELPRRALSPAQRERVDAILRSAGRIRDYMEQLRALTATGGPAEAGGRATAELSALAEGWAAAGRGLCAPRGLRFSLDCPASRPCTLFRSELDRAVLNLLDNAARFTPEGGAVRLSAYVEEAVLTVAVEDSGPGFSPEALARAGRGFYTGDASRPREGHMGMGLTFARQTARRHGGTLELSNTGRGARAALTLPL